MDDLNASPQPHSGKNTSAIFFTMSVIIPTPFRVRSNICKTFSDKLQ
jgi:hypothetical protein